MRRVIVTAETSQGRQAIAEVMSRSYAADIGRVPAPWARALLVDDVPVSFVLVDPDRRMEFPGGDVRYAYVEDVATRQDRRGEGHFRAIMEDTLASLRSSGASLVLTHGRYQLYRRFGFDVFTHHCGIFTSPEQIERTLGIRGSEVVGPVLPVEESRHLQEDLLLIADVRAGSLSEAKAAMQMAAALARSQGKARILFEHPAAPSYGSRYPVYPSLETPLTALARACGARICVQGAAPEDGCVPDADWIKVLDASSFLGEVVRCLGRAGPAPKGAVCVETEAGVVAVESSGGEVTVSGQDRPGMERVRWPSAALAQLATGYRSASVLGTIHDTPLSARASALLDALFPPRWRLSRNESWTFRA